jgi:hypothetical protein
LRSVSRAARQLAQHLSDNVISPVRLMLSQSTPQGETELSIQSQHEAARPATIASRSSSEAVGPIQPVSLHSGSQFLSPQPQAENESPGAEMAFAMTNEQRQQLQQLSGVLSDVLRGDAALTSATGATPVTPHFVTTPPLSPIQGQQPITFAAGPSDTRTNPGHRYVSIENPVFSAASGTARPRDANIAFTAQQAMRPMNSRPDPIRFGSSLPGTSGAAPPSDIAFEENPSEGEIRRTVSSILERLDEMPITVNRPAGVQVQSGRNVSMNLPLPEKFNPETDSWHTWHKALVYFFRTIRLPDILTEEGSARYSMDIHSNVITMLLRIIPESDRAWIVERDDQNNPDTVYSVWKYLALRYGTRNQMRLHEKLIAYEHIAQGQQESTTDYVLRLKRTVEDLATLGHHVDPLTHKLKLLRVNPTRGTGQDVHDMFISTLRTMITTLSIEDIEERLIMHQQSLLEQQRATQNAKTMIAAVNTSQVPHRSRVPNRQLAQMRPMDPAINAALKRYSPNSEWVRKNPNEKKECAIHKQLGFSQRHHHKDCWLRNRPEAAGVVQSIDDRMASFGESRKIGGTKPEEGAAKTPYKGPKHVRFK